MTKLRKAIEAELDKKLGDATLIEIAVSALAERLEPALGYVPSPTHVSRVLGELGWIKVLAYNHRAPVTFRRPPDPCHQCHGSRVSNGQICAACGGSGTIPPAGSADRAALDAECD